MPKVVTDSHEHPTCFVLLVLLLLLVLLPLVLLQCMPDQCHFGKQLLRAHAQDKGEGCVQWSPRGMMRTRGGVFAHL